MVLVGFDPRFGKGSRCTVADRLRWTFKCNRTLTGTTFLHEYQPPSTPGGGGGGVHAVDCNLRNCSLFFVLLLQFNKCFGRERLRANRSYFAPATREWKFVQRNVAHEKILDEEFLCSLVSSRMQLWEKVNSDAYRSGWDWLFTYINRYRFVSVVVFSVRWFRFGSIGFI